MKYGKENLPTIVFKNWSLIVIVTLGTMCSGCLTTFRTSSYETSPKPDSDIRNTHFTVETVSFDDGDADRIKKALQELESGQNKDLVPVPYSVTVSSNTEKIETDPVNGFLGVISLTVWPLWDGTRKTYDIQSRVFGDTIATKGVESDTTVYGWLMIPTGVLSSSLFHDDPHIDFRSGSVEERIAKAAFDSLTMTEYTKAVGEIRKDAELRKNQRQLQSLWRSFRTKRIDFKEATPVDAGNT